MNTITRTRTPIEEMLTLAIRAPSILNTQPWLWRWNGSVLTLLADRSRQLLHADPRGRDLVISCGAALHHLQVAAAGLGWHASVERLDPAQPDGALASVRFAASEVTPEQHERMLAISARQTDRRPSSDYPVPAVRIEEIADEGRRWGVQVLTDDGWGSLLANLTGQAAALQERDDGYRKEYAALERLSGSGLRPATPPDDHVDQFILFATSSDDPLSWLRVGEALSAVWLKAVECGLCLVPSTQALEVASTRASLEAALEGRTCPQLIAHVGWPPADRHPVAPTRRRPLGEVLVVSGPGR
jgi:hypothetical protein